MRKPYQKPAVDAEECLEQTSLACTLVAELPVPNGVAARAELNGTFDNYVKGGAWSSRDECDTPVLSDSISCNPYTVGVVLS